MPVFPITNPDPPPPILTSPRGLAMLAYLPAFFANSRVMQALFQAEGTQFDAIRATASDILNQTFASKATWALPTWEYELGLAPPPTVSTAPPGANNAALGLGMTDADNTGSTTLALTDAQRQQRLLGKLAGYGTATRNFIQNIVNAYDGGTVDVIEDTPHYSITIAFVSTAQQPSNLSDLQAQLRTVIPAHLDIQYTFSYLTWAKEDSFNWSWSALDGKNLTWDQLSQQQTA